MVINWRTSGGSLLSAKGLCVRKVSACRRFWRTFAAIIDLLSGWISILPVTSIVIIGNIVEISGKSVFGYTLWYQ